MLQVEGRAVDAAREPLRFWDDNPSLLDLLGFDAIMGPVLEAIGTANLDPLTIGVHSPWGGGKSTLLRLLDSSLSGDTKYVVVTTDPWQYDDHSDVRGTLIAEVLDVLRAKFDGTAGVGQRVGELLSRISWSRMALALGTGALTMQWNPKEIVEAFTPRQRSSPESMSGFKDAFEELIRMLPGVERVIVLVDDLDRCLPNAVMATLESIKLFLSVPKMVFVLAADQEMVRDAIAANLNNTSRSERFADRYLEKIVQLPVSLPRLTQHEAEAYIGLLLAEKHQPADDGAAYKALIAHCAARRGASKFPLLDDLDVLAWKPDSELLLLAAQLAQGLSADKLANPRQIKRFLNAFGVRSSIVTTREVAIGPSLLVKLLLLEYQHRSSFETLAAASGPERRSLLQQWENWARGEAPTLPPGIAVETREWAAARPYLSAENLDPYLVLAASLLDVRAGGQVSDEVAGHVRALLGKGDAERAAAVQRLTALSAAEQSDALDLLFLSGRRLDEPDLLFTAAIEWAKANNHLAGRVVEGLRDNWARLTTGAVVDLAASEVDQFTALLPEIAGDASIDQMVREAATIETGG
jgi:hypothetical protein